MGKGIESKTSRIFYQCYLKCCKLQNLTPLTNVIPSGNGQVLDFCVDRIKYADWPPILNSLSCDLSLHSVAIRCRQQVKTVLEQIDCERLAKTVNKRAVILTNFMLSNLVEALTQLLSNTTLLTSFTIEGLPLKIPYLNPLSEAFLSNNSLQHLYLSRCLIGDAGCLAVCKAVRCRPNILTLDLSGCELTPLGAGYIADLVKYQKIHRYSENWTHTLRYRLPELDSMAGLRRISVCGNPLGDAGVLALLQVLADDLWIKALDVQNCGLTEDSASNALVMMQSNTTLVVLDMRHNPEISSESLSKVRAALRQNERGIGGQYSWLSLSGSSSSESKLMKPIASKNGITRDRATSNSRNLGSKFTNKMNAVKKEKDYTEELEEKLQEEVAHRQQLEELNYQLVEQMRTLKQHQMRLWATASSGSEQSFQGSSRSYDLSSSSGSSSSVPIDQNTLSYIQQAFKDIYAFIKNNQCQGKCVQEDDQQETEQHPLEKITELTETEEYESADLRINMVPKKAHSTHIRLTENVKINKITKSAHYLSDAQHREAIDMRPEMFERQIGDTKNVQNNDQSVVDEIITAQMKIKKDNVYESSPCNSVMTDSSETLVCTPERCASGSVLAVNPRDVLYSSDEESS